MAIILYLPIVISGLIKTLYLKNLLFHLPLLIADIGIYFILTKIHPNRAKEIVYFYVLSPIIFYSTYIHTQLDIIPTFFVFASTYFLIKNKSSLSYLVLGLAVATKIHTIVALPFFLIYSYRKKILNYKDLYFLIPLMLTLLPFYLHNQIPSLFRAQEISLLFESYVQLLDLKIYLFPLVYLALLCGALNVKRYNTEIFIGILTIVFMTFVITIYPNPGWFIWSIPFLTYSFIKNNHHKKEKIITYTLVSMFYLIFFLFFYTHPLHPTSNFILISEKINIVIKNDILKNISLTMLISSSLYGIYYVFHFAISNSILYKRKFNAFVIGIAGDSGAGKSTLLESLSQLLGNNMVTQLEGDAEHKWARGDKKWDELTHLNPSANDLHQQMSHIIRLKRGLSTKRRDYNHQTGKFDYDKDIEPNDFVVIAGLHPYFLKGSRKHFDLKVFIETQEELRLNWKIERDTHSRGKSAKEVKEELDSRSEDSLKYIHPQKEYADLIIKYGIDQGANQRLTISYEIDADIYIDELIAELKSKGITIKEHSYSQDLTKQVLSLESFEKIDFGDFQIRFQDILDLCAISDPHWQSGIYGLNQVILFHCINEKYISHEYAND